YLLPHIMSSFFSCHAPAPPEIYTLSLHDALPICRPVLHEDVVDGALGRARASLEGLDGGSGHQRRFGPAFGRGPAQRDLAEIARDRKSTRLNSTHLVISYAVFCLKKKKKTKN